MAEQVNGNYTGFPTLIGTLSNVPGIGKAENLEEKPIRFYGAYGEILYAYSYEKIKELNELPPLPEYEGLVCQGWNWSLESLKNRNIEAEVGSLFITNDGSTRIYVDLIEGALSPKIGFYQLEANAVQVDWGDGSALSQSDRYGDNNMVSIGHTYAEPGEYVIRMIPGKDKEFYFAGNNYSSMILHKTSSNINGNQVYSNAIKKIEIGGGMTKLASECFRCSNLENVTIPESIISFEGAFWGCKSIRSITFPRGVTQVGGYEAESCSNLEKILFSDSRMKIDMNAFSKCSSLKKIILPKLTGDYSGYEFSECTSLSEIIFSEAPTTIHSGMFSVCESLRKIVIPEGVTRFSSYAFEQCILLEEIVIPDSVTNMDLFCLGSCYALRKVNLPNNMQTIAANVFYNCYSLFEITIPENVTSIKVNAFNGCSGVEHYYLLPKEPPVLASTNAFNGIAVDCIMHVPKGCLETYQTAENWSSYANRMVEMEE